MRVLFLDFDGVLNHPGTYARVERDHTDEAGKIWIPGDGRFRESEWLEPDLVAQVGALCVELGLTIAVVSTWRHRHDRDALAAILRERGLPEAVCVESCLDMCSKGDAVRHFLKTRPVRRYVVVDDGPGELPDPSRLVKTNGAVGLTRADAEQIRRLFT